MFNAKHQFKYTYSDTDLEDFPPVEITFDIPTGELTISQMLYNFESYLKACGFVFDGHLEVVAEESYDSPEEEYEGCMADFDKECGCDYTSSPVESKNEKLLREWNEGIAKLDNEQLQKAMKEAHEVAKNKWVHGICNPPSPDWKAQNKLNS